MNTRSLYTPWLASAALAIFLANAIVSHDPPHVEQSMDVSYMFPPESPAASGSVADSYAWMMNSYVNK